MATNIVCSDTYIDAFSKLDKKVQKKSLETIRLMQRSLRSDSLKVEKLNTKLDFKSARVTQDFRAIFTQSGNTVLLVYIDHHDDAYLWASNRLQGFDTASAKPVYEYFEQAKVEDFNTIEDESIDLANGKKNAESSKGWRFDPETGVPLDASGKPLYNHPNHNIQGMPAPTPKPLANISFGLFSRIFYFLAGIIAGIIIMNFI